MVDRKVWSKSFSRSKDETPEFFAARRNLIIISTVFLAYSWGCGDIGTTASFLGSNISLHRPKALIFLAWIALYYEWWRYGHLSPDIGNLLTMEIFTETCEYEVYRPVVNKGLKTHGFHTISTKRGGKAWPQIKPLGMKISFDKVIGKGPGGEPHSANSPEIVMLGKQHFLSATGALIRALVYGKSLIGYYLPNLMAFTAALSAIFKPVICCEL